jgi:hypothetical protein
MCVENTQFSLKIFTLLSTPAHHSLSENMIFSLRIFTIAFDMRTVQTSPPGEVPSVYF